MSLSLLKILADFDTQLATASSIGGTTATLVSATDDDGNALPSGTYGFTIDAGNSSKEYIICSLSGTSLTSIQSITRQGVTSSGFARSHRRGAKVTITDWAILSRMLNNLDGTTGFNSSVKLGYDADPSLTSGDTNKFATVKFVNDTAIAGAPDATTSVKGIVKMSTAPASATDPIAVGDNDPRVPTTDENDALVGTSGTPSSSNKFVTNDDTASSATASKVARRNATGDITVPTTPTASTDATSKSYVDAINTALDGRLDFTENTDENVTSWSTYAMNITTGAGWTISSTPTYYANGGTFSANTSSNSSIAVFGAASSNDGNESGISFGTGTWRVRIKAQITPGNDDDPTTTTKYCWFGLSSSTSSQTNGDITNVTDRVGVAIYDGAIYFVTANGTSVTATNIGTRTAANGQWDLVIVDFDNTTARVWLNGTAYTTTSNVPNSGNVLVAFGGYNSGGGAAGLSVISPVISTQYNP